MVAFFFISSSLDPSPLPKPVEGWVLAHHALGGTVPSKGQEWLGWGGVILDGDFVTLALPVFYCFLDTMWKTSGFLTLQCVPTMMD